MKLSLIIPVFNEEHYLEDFFANLLKINFGLDIEYLVIDDHSSDGSWSLIQKIASKEPRIRAYSQAYNQGKGSALQKGIALATGNIIAIQDADFEYDPNDLALLVKPIADGRADVVYGSRFYKTNPSVHRTFHYIVNRFLTLFSNILSGLYLSDMETCYKVFRADLLKNISLESKRFGFEPEITAILGKLNARIQEYGISYFPRSYADGKKINWKDGIAAIWFILKYNVKSLDKTTKANLPIKYLRNSSVRAPALSSTAVRS
jgi:glycosyltransferase involved in cell wall biosynthesis